MTRTPQQARPLGNVNRLSNGLVIRITHWAAMQKLISCLFQLDVLLLPRTFSHCINSVSYPKPRLRVHSFARCRYASRDLTLHDTVLDSSTPRAGKFHLICQRQLWHDSLVLYSKPPGLTNMARDNGSENDVMAASAACERAAAILQAT